jgi:serine protease AprX
MHRTRLVVIPFLLAALLGGLAGGAPIAGATTSPVLDSSQKVHPFLQFGKQAEPNRLVRVIVQKVRADVTSSTIAAQVPGLVVSEDFKVVPAFVATLPQGGVATLAQNANVRYVSPDAAVQVLPSVRATPTKPAPPPPAPKPVPAPKGGFDPSNLLTTYPLTTGAASAWTGAATPDRRIETGTNISVAVIDSGIDPTHSDLAGQVLAVNVNKFASGPADGYGHGTHVAGIINGHDADGQYLGVAPSATLISVKVSDDNGQAYESDLLRGIDWVQLNKDTYHIKVVNLSVSSGVAASYAVSPVDAAVEHLWQQNVTVVAAAGNLGPTQDAVWYAPGNDPYIITVGCLDENQTALTSDDSLCPISSRGLTEDGFAKPDLVAPGRKIVSALAAGTGGHGVVLAGEFPDRITADGAHIRLSGTSMAAPVVSGAVALLLQRHGGLVPNQIKQLLVNTSRGYPVQVDGAGALNIPGALVASDHPPAGDHYVPVPASGVAPPSGTPSLLWDGSRWSSTYFDGSRWSSAYWDGSRWSTSIWDGSRWSASSLDGSRWSSAYWDGSRWSSAYFDGSRWSNSAWASASQLD